MTAINRFAASVAEMAARISELLVQTTNPDEMATLLAELAEGEDL